MVRERAGSDGLLELLRELARARLESANRIARKLAEIKKSQSQQIGKVEFIAMKPA